MIQCLTLYMYTSVEHTDVVVSSSRQRQREQIKVKKNADSAETDSEDDVMRGVVSVLSCLHKVYMSLVCISVDY